jgi:hypothetical protein
LAGRLKKKVPPSREPEKHRSDDDWPAPDCAHPPGTSDRPRLPGHPSRRGVPQAAPADEGSDPMYVSLLGVRAV